MEKKRWIRKGKKEKERKKKRCKTHRLERNGIEGAEDTQGILTSDQLYKLLK